MFSFSTQNINGAMESASLVLVGPAVHIVPIRERATIKSKGLKVNLVTVVLRWVYGNILRYIMSIISLQISDYIL